MGDVRNITIVKFKNPFAEQINGKLRFTSNVSTFPSKNLKTESVKYSSPYKNKLRGVSYDKHFDITLIKNTSGICGTIINILSTYEDANIISSKKHFLSNNNH